MVHRASALMLRVVAFEGGGARARCASDVKRCIRCETVWIDDCIDPDRFPPAVLEVFAGIVLVRRALCFEGQRHAFRSQGRLMFSDSLLR